MKKNSLILLFITLFANQNVLSYDDVYGGVTWIRGKCLAPDGSLIDAHDVNESQWWRPGKIGVDDNKNLIHDVNGQRDDWLINACDNESNHQLNLEFDPEATLDVYSDLFGSGVERLNAEQEYAATKKNRSAYKFLCVYGESNTGKAVRIKRDNDHYALLELGDDSNKIITDNGLSNTIDLLLNQNIVLHENRIAQNIDDLLGSKIPVKKDLVLKQIQALKQLADLYKQNVSQVAELWGKNFKDLVQNKDTKTSKNPNPLKDTSYDNLSHQLQNITDFTNTIQVGASNADQGKLEEMKALVNQLDAFFSQLMIAKHNLPNVFQSMDKISNDMPGNARTDPQKINDSGKYRAQVRLLLQSVGGDMNAAKIFYNLEAMNDKLQILKKNIQADASIKGTFLPDLDQKISKFLNELEVVNKQRSSFESKLNQSAKKGKKQDEDGTVRQAFDTLSTAIQNLQKNYQTIQTSFQKGSAIQDTKFKNTLEAEKKRLDADGTLKKAIDDWTQYQANMTQIVSDAYQKAQDQEIKPITLVTNAMNQTITTLNATLQPIVDKLNSNQDATPEYTKVIPSIQGLVNLLKSSKEKLVNLETKIQDANQKTIITTAKNTIDAHIANVQQIESTAKMSAISHHFTQAEALRASLTTATGEFKIALTQYQKTRGATNTIMQAYNKVLASVQELLGLITTDLKNIATMDQKNALVINWKARGNLYVAPKTTPGSLQHILYNFATLPLTNLGLPAASPTS